MNRKSVLHLMELLIMVLVFAIAASVCVQCFAYAHRLSKEQEKKTAAILMVQNAAELLKGASGDFSAIESQLGGSGTEQVWQVPMDQNWDAVPKLEQATYLLLIEKTSATAPYLGMASMQLQCRGETLVEITVAWQEDM